MKLLQTLLIFSISQLCPVATAQQSAIDGTSADWRNGGSQQEARTIEDQRYKDVIAGLDAMKRKIYADWLTDKLACGNDSRTNASCLKAAADKRDKQIALENQLRAQANALHGNQLDAIYRYWEKGGRIGDIISSRGGGNPVQPAPAGDPGGTSDGGWMPGGNRGGGNPARNPGRTPNPNGNGGNGNPGGNGGGNPNPLNIPADPGGEVLPVCKVEPDWVRTYKAQGADPPLRYKTGFYQGVAQCLQDQCTLQNLAVAVWVAAFTEARAVLAVSAIPSLMDVAVHPPGFSPDPDPFTRGRDEGSKLCNWLMKLSAVSNVNRIPLAGSGGKIAIPKGFDFYKAVNTIPEWLPKINPSGCDRNCGVTTANSVRVLFGRPLDPAPRVSRGMTDAQMQQELGSKFGGMPYPAAAMDQFLLKMPEGTVAVISAENPAYGGVTPATGPLTNPNDSPGHFFFGTKAKGDFQYWSGQSGGPQAKLPGNWIYRWTIVGNALNP